MKSRFKKDAGDYGEELAAKYLQKKGFAIIERNFRIKGGEIDVLAIDKRNSVRTLVCIEVKTRSGDKFGIPLESITYFKLKALKKTLLFYKSVHPDLPELLRIDAVSVYKTKAGEYEIEHHENISGGY